MRRIAAKLAMYCAGRTGVRSNCCAVSGERHRITTVPAFWHSRQDIDADDQPERDPQQGH